MSNKDQNNNSWKARLDALENIPGEQPYDKSRAWGKLYLRTQNKPSPKRKYWYWMAAASVITSFLVSLAFIKERSAANIYGIRLTEHVSLTMPYREISTQQETIAKAAGTFKKSIQPAKRNTKTESISVADNNTVQQIIQPPGTIVSITGSETVKDTMKAAITVVVPRNKLPVVHINELRSTNTTTTTASGNNNFLPFRRAPKDVSSNTSAGGTQGDHIIIRNLNTQNQD